MILNLLQVLRKPAKFHILGAGISEFWAFLLKKKFTNDCLIIKIVTDQFSVDRLTVLSLNCVALAIYLNNQLFSLQLLKQREEKVENL